MEEFERVENQRVVINLKDIQLKFPYPNESFKAGEMNFDEDCWSCFNNPCTCENRGKHRNPYDVKRESDLSLEKKEEKKANKP